MELKKAIFTELSSGGNIDPFRKNLQRAFVDKMTDLMNVKDDRYDQTNIKAIARGTLKTLKREVSSATSRQSDTAGKYHLEDLEERINMILDPK